MSRFALAALILLSTITASHAADVKDAATAPEVRAGVERSLGFLEKKGVAWLDSQKCIACHHGAWMVWGFNEAKQAGILVDPQKLDALTGRVDTMYLSLRKGFEKNKGGWVESTYMLMSQYDTAATDKRAEEWRKMAIERITAGQRNDGSWKYAGQGLDRPDAENDESTTLWALLTLPVGDKGDAAELACRDKALAWLKKTAQLPSIDSLALRLAVELRFGDAGQAAKLKDELIARQNADGSFNWNSTHPGDAFATGESLYALSLAGVKCDAPVIQKAWKFLLSTQKPDGSWACATRKPKGGSEISTYWGTAWAVIGLSKSLPTPAVTAAAR